MQALQAHSFLAETATTKVVVVAAVGTAVAAAPTQQRELWPVAGVAVVALATFPYSRTDSPMQAVAQHPVEL
jgi:hypothetical protein